MYWLEIGSELINGATLKLKYSITIHNKSDDNITDIKLIDYLPKGMSIDYDSDTNRNNWEAFNKNEIDNLLDESITSDVKSVGKTIITNTNGISVAPKGDTSIEVEATITLSPDMDEYNYTNLVEILEYTSEKGRKNTEGIPGNEKPSVAEYRTEKVKEQDADKSEEFAITKTTGEDRSGTAKYYYLLGVMIQITIILGIAFVKKYKL